MALPADPSAKGLASELKTVLRRARQVWGLVSRKRRRTFLFASFLMVISASANTVTMLWLGGLVDAMEGKRSPDAISRLPLVVAGLAGEHAWAEVRPQATPLPSPAEATSNPGGQPAAAVTPGAVIPGTVNPDAVNSATVTVGGNPPSAASAAGAPLVATTPPRALLLRIATAFLAMVAACYLAREALQVIRKCLVENTCTQIEKETTVALVAHFLRVDLSRLSAERVGALHGRIHRSVEGFIKFFKLSFMDFFPAIFLAGFALWGAFLKQPWIALVMAAVIPCSLFITVRQILSQKGVRVELMRKRESLDGTVVEQLGGIEYIRAANTLDLEVQRVAQVAEERRSQEVRHHWAMAFFDAAKALNEGFFYILMVAASIYLAVLGEITIGSIVTFSGLYLGVMAPLREVHRILDDAHESSIRVEMLMQMMEEPVDHSFRLPTVRRPSFEAGRPVIVAENLQMDYRTHDGRMRRALDGVSMVIKGGETIGAAGPSGSGKSTWLKAVMRLIHPTGGTLILGGEPIEAISREVIGDTIGYVSQTPFVFAGTVADNIAYGTSGASPAQLEDAARQAFIHDEILAMPGGYQAMLAERGQNLSGGQRQRIALARIFLRNPPILILDEGTSALDNISERKIQEALAAARRDRTLILVAHRLSTLRDADRILVFNEGRLAEEGTYEALLARNGIFTELVKSAGDDRPGTA